MNEPPAPAAVDPVGELAKLTSDPARAESSVDLSPPGRRVDRHIERAIEQVQTIPAQENETKGIRDGEA